MTSEPILFLVSRGLLEHKPRMGGAIWVYLSLLDKVTKDTPAEDGKFNGLVLGGVPFKAETIAHELHEHVQTVLRSLRTLEGEGYIIRKRHAGNLSSFIVTNSKKWFWRRVSKNASSRVNENALSDAQSEQNRSVRVSENALSNKERHDRDTTIKQNKRPSAFDGSSMDLPEWLPKESWLEWCQHRREKKEPLTQLAAEKSIARLDRYRTEGYQPKDIIDHSIANGYQGLYPPSKEKPKKPGSGYHEIETRAETAERLARQKVNIV